MIEKAKNLGWTVLGLGILLFFLLIGAFMLNGAVWVGEHVIDWLITISWIVLAVDLFILVPLSLSRRFGMYGGIGIFFSSNIFGLTLWFLGLLLTYSTWGFLGVIIGLFLGGVGVIPVAMLAMLVNGEFSAFFGLLLLVALTIGSKILGAYLASRAEERMIEHQR